MCHNSLFLLITLFHLIRSLLLCGVGFTRAGDLKRKEVYEGPDGAVTVNGKSNNEGACSSALTDLFKNEKECPVTTTTPNSFNCVYQPKFVTESPNFLVFENFFYTSSALSVQPATPGNTTITTFPLLTTPKNFLTASNEICSVEWSAAQLQYPKDSQPKDTTLKLCFSSSYAGMFLTKGLGLDAEKVVTVQKEVDGSEIEWALGALPVLTLPVLTSRQLSHS